MKRLALALFVLVGAAAIALAVMVTRSSSPVAETESHRAPAVAVQPPAPLPVQSPSPSDPPPPPPAQRNPPPMPQTAQIAPRDKRAADRAELEASGRTSAGWTRGASEVFTPAATNDVHFGPVECFAGGCITTATYTDYAAYNALNRSLPDSEAFRNWPGSKRRSPPEQLPDGRLAADWTLFPPAADEQLAMQQGETR